MKITISSPDGLGDFVLRMPLFQSLQEAGHELQILMRPPAADLAAAVLPRAKVERIGQDPYSRLVRFRRNPFVAERALVAAFAPDLYVVALFQQSFFDEILLAKRRKNFRVAGFRSKNAFWATSANTLPQQIAHCLDIAVEVPTETPETEKSRLLSEAILESAVPVRRVRVTPPEPALTDAREILRAKGLRDGNFLVVCAGSRPGLEIKDWGESNWTDALTQIALETRLPFIFLGNRAESKSIERIGTNLPNPTENLELASNPPSILTSFGIIALSAGFVGRDSGPMHLAAACGRPLLAISSGWLWGRFFPDADEGVIVSRHVPCQGCLGYCHLPEPFCVRRVTVDQFLAGWRLLRSGTLRGTRIVETPLDEKLASEIVSTAHLRFVPLAHETTRESFESGRAVNLLDTAGMLLRVAARRRYAKKFSKRRTQQ